MPCIQVKAVQNSSKKSFVSCTPEPSKYDITAFPVLQMLCTNSNSYTANTEDTTSNSVGYERQWQWRMTGPSCRVRIYNQPNALCDWHCLGLGKQGQKEPVVLCSVATKQGEVIVAGYAAFSLLLFFLFEAGDISGGLLAVSFLCVSRALCEQAFILCLVPVCSV